MKVRVVNMIPQSQSNESNDDSETNIALDPADARKIGGHRVHGHANRRHLPLE